ncbi:MAG: hypothetical protein CM15mP120_05520 [Pseudomonadota bacterium]|nr:MAG: hypothetical protein CM15mP120_05520 [Pseudomonadota bacterium]
MVVAAVDPNPQVSGQGIAMLEAAGVEVEVVELASAKACHPGFCQSHHPWSAVCAVKDGDEFGRCCGAEQWRQPVDHRDAARSDVQYWRAHSDAIVTGIGSVLADDCQLTVRDSAFKHAHAPLRVVLDSRGPYPPDAKY